MKWNGVPFFSTDTPCCTEPAVQNVLLASRACPINLNCSNSLVIMMYQLPIDMITRMMSVPRATKSPPFHSASSPYGLATVSFATGGGTGVGAAASLVAASSATGAVAAVCDCAYAAGGTTMSVTTGTPTTSTAASSA